MTLEHVVKVNDTIFTILSQPADGNAVLRCPDGHICHLDFKRKKLFHRDCDGKIQVAPALNF